MKNEKNNCKTGYEFFLIQQTAVMKYLNTDKHKIFIINMKILVTEKRIIILLL